MMGTRPAKASSRLMPASGFPNLNQAVNMASTAPVARLVLTKIMAMPLLAAYVFDKHPPPVRPRLKLTWDGDILKKFKIAK